MPVKLNGETYYRTAEACRLAGTSKNTFLRWVMEGTLVDVECRDRRGWRLFTQKDLEKYIKGDPEEIYSKLNVEPVLRTYLLSLIATDFVSNKKQILDFFSKTFWAFQYEDMMQLEFIIDKMLDLLEKWEFIQRKGNDDFVSGDDLGNEKIKPTFLGKRVAELYLDPLTANYLIECIKKSVLILPILLN